MKFKEVNFDELFDFPSINAGITEEFIFNNKGEIPVYGSRKDGKPIGYINGNLPLKYFQNCVTWNRNGSVGYTFYRDHLFITSDDHRPLYIKDEYKTRLDIKYLRYMVQKVIFANGFAWDNKAGVDKMKLLYLPLPIKEDGSFDLKIQQKIAKKYKLVEDGKKQALDYLKTIKNCVVKVEQRKDIPYKNVELREIVEIISMIKLDSGLLPINGKYPIYFQSRGISIEGYTDISDNIYMKADERIILFGDHNRETKVIYPPFGVKDNIKCMKILNGDLDPYYIAYIINKETPYYGYARHFQHALKTDIPIPIKKDGTYDLEEQQRIAKKYQNIESKRSEAIDMLKRIINTQVKITLD